MPLEHILERRTTRLSAALTERKARMVESLTGPQGRIPWRVKLSETDSLKWWSEHRYDAIGAKEMATYRPEHTASLDLALTRYVQQQEAMGIPTITEPNA